MKAKLLSIIVPVYNTENYLRECINSILQQSYKQIEIILVDDGSIDESAKICDEYANKYDNVICIHKENAGACYARRDGLRMARGEYVGFVDSDDFIENKMYEELMAYVDDGDADIVTSGFMYDNGVKLVDLLDEGLYEDDERKVIYGRMIFEKEKQRNGILCSVCTKIYRRELLIKYLENVPEGLCVWEDLAYTYLPFLDALRIQVTHKCLYHYRQHANSTSHRIDERRFDNMVYSFGVSEKTYELYGEELKSQVQQLSCHCLLIWLRGELESVNNIFDQKHFEFIRNVTYNEFFLHVVEVVKLQQLMTLPSMVTVFFWIRKGKKVGPFMVVYILKYLRRLRERLGKALRTFLKGNKKLLC